MYSETELEAKRLTRRNLCTLFEMTDTVVKGGEVQRTNETKVIKYGYTVGNMHMYAKDLQRLNRELKPYDNEQHKKHS